ncbi:MAG: histidine kinase, partial [Phaeodactylibacter sp.]|nr:histidine kinase [Phaeodactylibacter sp.]
DLYPRMLANLVNVPLFMAAYYLLKHVQIPHLYNRGKMGAFILSLLVSSLAIAAFCRLNGVLWMDRLFGVEGKFPFLTPVSYVVKTVRFYTPAMAILAWDAHQERRRELDRIQSLEKEKIATELKFLKGQINPHFLFNTLNNLYSYVLNQSPKAPAMILQLSGILDYVLYKSQQKTVPLSEEISTITNFLKLEQTRYGERLQVDFKTAGDLKLPVSPLILLSLVENAFKHGASGDIDQPQIQIDLVGEEASIRCRVWNTKSRDQGELNDAFKEGIGLSNIRRQLNLSYPNRHQLDIEEDSVAFCVNLSINTRP